MFHIASSFQSSVTPILCQPSTPPPSLPLCAAIYSDGVCVCHAPITLANLANISHHRLLVFKHSGFPAHRLLRSIHPFNCRFVNTTDVRMACAFFRLPVIQITIAPHLAGQFSHYIPKFNYRIVFWITHRLPQFVCAKHYQNGTLLLTAIRQHQRRPLSDGITYCLVPLPRSPCFGAVSPAVKSPQLSPEAKPLLRGTNRPDLRTLLNTTSLSPRSFA